MLNKKLEVLTKITMEFMKSMISNWRIFLFGRSLGGAGTTKKAMNQGNLLKGIILENTFTCIGDMVDKLLPLIAPCKFLVQRIFYPTIDRIG